jgi:hypothetical protein
MVTLEEIKADIKSGKSKKIYLSDKFLWWTHLESDLVDATMSGEKYVLKNDPFGLEKLATFTDPLGGKININNNPSKFIVKTLLNPKHYGKHRIQAFLKAHHQNCDNFFSNKWDRYNKLIDRQKNGTT